MTSDGRPARAASGAALRGPDPRGRAAPAVFPGRERLADLPWKAALGCGSEARRFSGGLWSSAPAEPALGRTSRLEPWPPSARPAAGCTALGGAQCCLRCGPPPPPEEDVADPPGGLVRSVSPTGRHRSSGVRRCYPLDPARASFSKRVEPLPVADWRPSPSPRRGTTDTPKCASGSLHPPSAGLFEIIDDWHVWPARQGGKTLT